MKTVEQILLETEAAIAAVRAGKVKPEEAAHQLKPFAKHAAPRIVDEMRRSITQIEYTIQLEAVLSKLPPEELKVPIQKALADKAVRLSAARVVGASGDRELSKVLEAPAAGDDEDLALMAGESMVRCRNAAGVPALVRCLRSEQRDTRTIAINALRPLNRGQDFGYRAPLAPMENAAAIRQWDEWAEKFGRTIFD
jgi:HEAT repeat protein